MAYQVLARKYRPQRFADVAGQEHVTRTLLNALSQGRIAHGYIFSGHRGIGKTTIARILAMALNCRTAVGAPERPSPEPCGVCDSCREIRAGNAVDVIEIDAATNRGIDEIRELRDAARYSPARDRYKIYILDEAHQITDAAFNALLKTLEEPPDHVVFMMATTQPEDIPQTIRSRCQHYSFHAVRFDDILAQLKQIAAEEQVDADSAALALLAEAGDGSMRDALSIMDQAIASAPLVDGRPRLEAQQILELMGTVPNTVFERLLEAVSENQSATVMEEIDRLLNAGNSPSQLARQLVRYLRNCLMAKLGGEGTELLQVSADERARAARSAMLFSEEDLTRFLQIMLRTFDDLNYRQEQRFHLELGLLKLVHLQRLLPLEQILSQLPGAQLSGTAGRGAPTAASRSAAPTLTPSRPAERITPSPQYGASDYGTTPPGAARPPAAPDTPSLSPFEADRSRKARESGESESGPGGASNSPITGSAPSSIPASQTLHETRSPRVPSPLESASGNSLEAKAPASAAPVPGSPRSGGSTEGSLALAAQPAPALTEPAADVTAQPHTPAPHSAVHLDAVRDAVVAALEEKGHNTAAALLSAGRWTMEDDAIRAEVGIKKTMLALTMNAEAWKIVRDALRQAGATQKMTVVPGEAANGSAAPAGSTASRPAASSGSIQAAALENPLVRQAQELFRAEVRSVLDLRDKR